jgi:hypothetical protein
MTKTSKPPIFSSKKSTGVEDLGDSTPSMRIGNNHACVNCKGLASHDPFLHAARRHCLEQLAQQIAVAETAMTVLGKRRMIGNVGIGP